MSLMDLLTDGFDWLRDNWKGAIITGVATIALWEVGCGIYNWGGGNGYFSVRGPREIREGMVLSNSSGNIRFEIPDEGTQREVDALRFMLGAEGKSVRSDNDLGKLLIAVDGNNNGEVTSAEVKPHRDYVADRIRSGAVNEYGLNPNCR